MSNDKDEIRIYMDGDMWCALRGEDLQIGESGFGTTPEEALCELLKLKPRRELEASIKFWKGEAERLNEAAQIYFERAHPLPTEATP